MHKVEIEKQSYTIRSSWAEMPAGLVLLCMPYVLMERQAGAAGLLPILSDIPEDILAKLQPWQYAKLMPMVHWVWDEKLTMPILPHFVHNGQTYYLPEKELLNSSLVEYDHAENFYREIIGEDPAEGAIESLVAALCRIGPGVNAYDSRMRFDARAIEQQKKDFATLDARVKLYVLWFFRGCYEKIREDYAMLWETDKSPKDKFAAYRLQQEEWIEFGWIGAAFEAAEEGAFGTFEQVLFTDVHTMLYYFSFKKQQAKKIRAQNKKGTTG